MSHKAIHGKNRDDGGYSPPRLSMCRGPLLIVT